MLASNLLQMTNKKNLKIFIENSVKTSAKLKNIANFFVLLFFLMNLSSCAINSSAPAGPGFLYTESSELTYYDPYIKPQIKATLCSNNILGLFSFGDQDFISLQVKTPIRKINSIEKTHSSRLGIFARTCTIYKGE